MYSFFVNQLVFLCKSVTQNVDGTLSPVFCSVIIKPLFETLKCTLLVELNMFNMHEKITLFGADSKNKHLVFVYLQN